jgi:hypothetical protein
LNNYVIKDASSSYRQITTFLNTKNAKKIIRKITGTTGCKKTSHPMLINVLEATAMARSNVLMPNSCLSLVRYLEKEVILEFSENFCGMYLKLSETMIQSTAKSSDLMK